MLPAVDQEPSIGPEEEIKPGGGGGGGAIFVDLNSTHVYEDNFVKPKTLTYFNPPPPPNVDMERRSHWNKCVWILK